VNEAGDFVFEFVVDFEELDAVREFAALDVEERDHDFDADRHRLERRRRDENAFFAVPEG